MLEEMLSSGFAKYHPIYDWLVITRDGHVYSTKGGRNNKRTHEYYTYIGRNGYVCIKLYLHGSKKMLSTFVHRLVAQTFVDNPNNYDEVNHIDGNKINNHADNLEWCTHKQNIDKYFKSNAVQYGRCVEQYDMQGNLISTYPSIASAQRAINPKATSSLRQKLVGKCANGYYMGFMWKLK